MLSNSRRQDGSDGAAVRRIAVAAALLVLAADLVGVAAGTPEATVEHEGESPALESVPGQTVHGTTSLEPGETVTVRLRSASESIDEPLVGVEAVGLAGVLALAGIGLLLGMGRS